MFLSLASARLDGCVNLQPLAPAPSMAKAGSAFGKCISLSQHEIRQS
jgi:hypothetical protein